MCGRKVPPNGHGQLLSAEKSKTPSYRECREFMAGGCGDDDDVEAFLTGAMALSGLERSKTTAMSMPRRRLQRRKASPSHPYRGIWRRGWGRWSAEIRDPIKGFRVWIGTFDTASDAAHAFDAEARRIHGSKAKTNFPAAELAALLDSGRLNAGLSPCSTTTDSAATSSEVYHSKPSDGRILLECCSDDVMDSLFDGGMTSWGFVFPQLTTSTTRNSVPGPSPKI